jgi:hypothetical protein
VSGSWLSVDSLRHDKGSVFLRLLDRRVVRHHAVQETLTRLRVLHVFDSDVDALRDDATIVLFVDDDTNGSSGNVEDASGGSVVDFVRHSLLDGTVTLDIDDVALAVTGEVRLQPDDSPFAEVFAEHVPRSASDTFRVRHFSRRISNC